MFVVAGMNVSFYPNVITLRSGSLQPSQIRLSPACFVRPTQLVEIFRNVSTPLSTLPFADLHAKLFGDRLRKTPPAVVKRKKGSKI